MTLLRHPLTTRNDFFGNRFFNEFFNEKAYDNKPAVNIKQNEESYLLEFQVPGYQKSELNIALENNVLTVSGEHQNQNDKEKEGYTRKEFSKASFSRSFTLPENKVNDEAISAKYENGVLFLTLPIIEDKKEELLKKIEIV